MSGTRMDHDVEVDFAGFKNLVDAIGGVTVTVDQGIHDTSSGLDLTAGTHRLNGTQSLEFVRTRHGIGDGSDLGRIGLQQTLVKALLEQISATDLLTSPTRLYRVADAVTGSLTTDTGLDSLTRLMELGRSLKGLSAANVTTVTLPVLPASSDPNRVVPDEPEASDLWESLRRA